MKKVLAIVLTLAMFVCVLSACGSSSQTDSSTAQTSSDSQAASTDSSENITLKLYHNWTEASQLVYFEEAAAKFKETHPNVDIVITNIADPDYTTKLNLMLGTNDAPDIFFTWVGEYLNKFSRNDLVMDLEPYYTEDSEWKDSFMSSALSPFYGESGSGIYGVPFRVDCKMMVYNKDIFQELNLEVPETWDEFINVCQTLKDNGYLPIALGISEAWAACHYITTFNAATVPNDVRLKDYIASSGEFTDSGYVTALERFKSLNDMGFFTPNTVAMDFDSARNDFLIGKAGMTYMQAVEFWHCDENNLNCGCFTIPSAEGDAESDIITGSPDGFCVSSTCKNPDLAVEFLKLLTSVEWQDKMVKELSSPSSVNGVMNESNSDAVTLEAVSNYSTAKGFANWLDSEIDSRIADVYVPGLQEIIAGTKTPEQLMEEVQAVAAQVRAG